MATSVESRLWDHVDRLGAEHPPIPLASADHTMARPLVGTSTRTSGFRRQEAGHVAYYKIAAQGLWDGLDRYAEQVGRVEGELLWAQCEGLKVPAYVVDALRHAADLARTR